MVSLNTQPPAKPTAKSWFLWSTHEKQLSRVYMSYLTIFPLSGEILLARFQHPIADLHHKHQPTLAGMSSLPWHSPEVFTICSSYSNKSHVADLIHLVNSGSSSPCITDDCVIIYIASHCRVLSEKMFCGFYVNLYVMVYCLSENEYLNINCYVHVGIPSLIKNSEGLDIFRYLNLIYVLWSQHQHEYSFCSIIQKCWSGLVN